MADGDGSASGIGAASAVGASTVASPGAGAATGAASGRSPYEDELDQTFRLESITARTGQYPLVLAEAVGANDALTLTRGYVIAEQLGLLETLSPTTYFGLGLSDTAGIAPTPLAGWPIALADAVGVAPGLTVQALVTVLEALGLTPTLGAQAIYGRTLAQSLRVIDSLARFVDGTVAETIGIAPTYVANMAQPGSLAEGIGIAPSLTARLLVRVTAAEGVGIDDTEVLQALYSPVLTDEIEITAAYLSPGGGFTTWAINTRSGATTEYADFAFNSFARMGTRYLGASSTGLYTLDGDDDDGTDIVATIKSGFAQFSGGRLNGFKGVYLGVRGGGDYVLRIETADGRTTDYAVVAEDMKTTKVKIGKGLRARYFAFELISDGQDFDLESIEFVPMYASRRV